MNESKSLKQLVDLAMQRRDASGLALSHLAQSAGYQITATTINAIRQGTYKSTPKRPTLEALAWLAGVDASVAFTAAGQPVPGPPFSEELPPGVDNLSPMSRKVVIDMVRRLVDLEKNADASSTQDHEQPADVDNQGAEPRNAGAGQKTHLAAVPDTVTPLDDDALDRLHQERWQDLAAKKAHGGISHDQNPEDT